MADKEIRVSKKIVWGWNGVSKELIKAYKVGERICSSATKIVIGDNITEWYLSFYPGGHREECKDKIVFFLCLNRAESKNFKTKFTLGIAGKNGDAETEMEELGESFEVGRGLGSSLLMRGEFFNLNLGYLIDGKVTLYCELTIIAQEITEKEKKDSLNQSLLGRLQRMMSDEIFKDFYIETTEMNNEKKVLKAHKHVLASGSPYFYGLLTTAMKETEDNIVKVPEDSAVMKEVLRFIYSNEVENLDAIACELVFAAEKYQLDDLKKMCLDSIIKMLSTENVLQTLMAADLLTKSEKLKEKCFEVIASDFQFICKSKEWKKLTQSLLLEMTCRTIGKDNDTIYV